jgi:hypothetical protein
LHKKTKRGSNSKKEEEGKYHERIDNHRKDGYSISDTRTQRNHSPPYLAGNYYAYEDSISIPKVSPIRYQRRMHEVDILQGDLRKLKPPSFDGQSEREDDVEAFFLGIKRYFQLHNYSSNL